MFLDEELKRRMRKCCFEKDEKTPPVLKEAIDTYLREGGC